MATSRGTFGELKVFEDFMHFEDNIAASGVATGIVYGAGYISVGDLGMVSVNEGSLAWTIDEDGGILAITTDTGDNDNAFLLAGRYRPANGGVETETRLKFASVTLDAIEAGFTETLAFNTPVMPAEFATATMTYNGSGGMMGANLDPDASANDFRAFGGDGGAGAGGSSTTGVRANETITADEWYVLRTEIGTDGNGAVYVGHKSEQYELIAATNAVQGNSWTGAVLTPGDQFYAIAGVENRSGAASIAEFDYVYARGWRDWTVG